MKDKIFGWVQLVLTIVLPWVVLAFIASAKEVHIAAGGHFAVQLIASVVGAIIVAAWVMTWVIPQYLVWSGVKDVPTPVRRAASLKVLTYTLKSFLLQASTLSAFFALPIILVFVKKDAKRLPAVFDLFWGKKSGLDSANAIAGFAPGTYGHRLLNSLKGSGELLALKLGAVLNKEYPAKAYGNLSTVQAHAEGNYEKEYSGNYLVSCGNHFQVGSITNLLPGWQIDHQIGINITKGIPVGSDDTVGTQGTELPLIYRSFMPVRL